MKTTSDFSVIDLTPEFGIGSNSDIYQSSTQNVRSGISFKPYGTGPVGISLYNTDSTTNYGWINVAVNPEITDSLLITQRTVGSGTPINKILLPGMSLCVGESIFGSAAGKTYITSSATHSRITTGAAGVGTGLWFEDNTAGHFRLNNATVGSWTSTGLNSITIGATTAAAGTFTALTATGATILGDASTDTVTVNGYMGVGGAAVAGQLLTTTGTLSASNPVGISDRASIIATGGTVAYKAAFGDSGSIALNTSGVVSVAATVAVDEPVITVSTGSLTNAASLYISEGPTEGGALNANIYTNAATGANKWNIYASGTAANYFAGNVGVGTTNPKGSIGYATQSRVVGIAGDGTASTTSYGGLNLQNNRATPSASDVFGAITFESAGSVGTYKAGIVSWADGAGGVTGGYGASLRFMTRANDSASDPVERMRIDSVGLVTMNNGLAVTGALSASGAISTGSGGATNAGLQIVNGSAGVGSGYGGIYAQNVTPSTSNWSFYTTQNASSSGINGSTNSILYVADSAIATATSTGLAVTGSLSASGAATLSAGVSLPLPSIGGSTAIEFPYYGNANAKTRIVATGTSDHRQVLKVQMNTAQSDSAPVDAVVLDASGNVGIGTSATYQNSALEVLRTDSSTYASSGVAAFPFTPGGAVTTLANSAAGDNTAVYLNLKTTNAVSSVNLNYIASVATSGRVSPSLVFGARTASGYAERLRIDADGNLGLGVTPSVWTSFMNVIQGASYAIASGTNSGQTTRWFNNIYHDGNYRYANGSYPGSWIEQTGGGVNFYAFTGNHGAGNIPSAHTGLLAVEKDKSVALQGATSQTGTGVTFPATQSASSDANTLDDYEEGIFTPTIVGVTTAGVGTYTRQMGRYTKIGNVVYYRINVTWTAHTGTGNMLVGALPFTSNGNSGNDPPCTTYIHNITLTASNVAQCFVSQSSTQIVIAQYPAGGGASTVVPIAAAGQILLEGHYEI